MQYKTIWSRIIWLLKQHKISRKKFAEHINIPYKTLLGWIRNNRIPDLETAHVMAFSLGVSLEYLATGNDRDYTAKRLKELVARESAARIKELALKIEQESHRIYERK